MAGTALDQVLLSELSNIDGVNGINPETGRDISNGGLLKGMTTRLFGAPFQLLDSVDHRFPNINTNVGNEYLRNFLLNSPILYIHPGLPRYTGGDDSEFGKTIMDMFNGNMGGSRLLLGLAKSLPFASGSKLQRRMFGFKQTYMEYMSYVNYMCRSAAIYLGLTDVIDNSSAHKNQVSGKNGAFISQKAAGSSPKYTPFSEIKWENYRFLGGYAQSTSERLKDITGALGNKGKELLSGFFGIGTDSQGNSSIVKNDSNIAAFSDLADKNKTINETKDNQLTSVAFMVEPCAFTESISNTTSASIIESTIDGLDQGVGSEIAFITGSNVDAGVLGQLTSFLGNTVADASSAIAKVVQPVTGGFTTNLFNGALNSLKGQKMIYPDIYRSSQSAMDYEFDVTLTTPYGDPYNYYMNILVPLLHLIALAAPRMVSANSTTSPFLVQAYIPGMCTCQLGIISDMTITKNPTSNHVSVDGFPLTVKVHFTIKELYNSMAISPANDPVSFLFNETLNDYLVNLEGLVPSMATYETKQEALFKNLSSFFTPDSLINSALSGTMEWVDSGLSR
jgi:hypothetical protein